MCCTLCKSPADDVDVSARKVLRLCGSIYGGQGHEAPQTLVPRPKTHDEH